MNALDNLARIRSYDKSGMLRLIESFSDQCRDAKRLGYSFKLPKGFRTVYKNVVCSGMGGSAIGADIIRSYVADDAEIPVFVNRNYGLPNFVDKDSLVIVSSYSGETEETLSAYCDARSRGSEIIVITSGGQLGRKAAEDNIPCVKIPSGLPPRAALGYSFFPLLILFSKLEIIKDQSALIDDAVNSMANLKNSKLGSAVKSKDNPAKKIANEIFKKIVIIYAGQDHMESVVTRWKGQLAENSKTLASSSLFPEMSHNEIVGWEYPKKNLQGLAVIMLRDAADHPRTSKRMDVTKNILKKMNIDAVEVASTGRELLTRMFSLIYMGDFVSFYLAILNGVDPTPVERIAYLKKEMGR